LSRGAVEWVCEDGVRKRDGRAGETVGAMRRLGATGAVVFRLRHRRGFDTVAPVDQACRGFALPLGQKCKCPEVMPRGEDLLRRTAQDVNRPKSASRKIL